MSIPVCTLLWLTKISRLLAKVTSFTLVIYGSQMGCHRWVKVVLVVDFEVAPVFDLGEFSGYMGFELGVFFSLFLV